MLPSHLPLKVISVDASFKDNADSDFVAIEVWGKLNADFYLIDMLKRRMDFPDTLKAIKAMDMKYPDRHSILIEDKANGPAIIAMLRHEMTGIVPVNPEGSKLARANAVTGIIESGNVLLPRYADFTGEFIEEHAAFPNGVNDDLVDSCTQFLNKYKFFCADYAEDNRTRFEKDLEKYKNKVLRQSSKSRRRYY